MSSTSPSVWPSPDATPTPPPSPGHASNPPPRSAGRAAAGTLVAVALVGVLVGVGVDRVAENVVRPDRLLPASILSSLPHTTTSSSSTTAPSPPSASTNPAAGGSSTPAQASNPAPAQGSNPALAQGSNPAAAREQPGRWLGQAPRRQQQHRRQHGSTGASGSNPAPAQGTNPAPAAAADPAQQAVQQVIQKGDTEQAQAVSSKDLSVMSDTSTPDFLQQQQQATQDLLNNGVTSIDLANIEWGPIAINGTTATATNYETWTTTYTDGTTDQSRDRNDYTLVQQNGAWLVQSDAHPDDTAGCRRAGRRRPGCRAAAIPSRSRAAARVEVARIRLPSPALGTAAAPAVAPHRTRSTARADSAAMAAASRPRPAPPPEATPVDDRYAAVRPIRRQPAAHRAPAAPAARRRAARDGARARPVRAPSPDRRPGPPARDACLWRCWRAATCCSKACPGLAKTATVKALARVVGSSFGRVQFTPDLVPADLVGTRIYTGVESGFVTELGPVFANLVLADEINRASAKVQSALLEVMQEHQVTIGKQSYPVPEPFLVLATQNPIESDGTYPLPEAQLDRFMFKVLVDYPSYDDELVVVQRVTGPAIELRTVLDPRRLLELQSAVDQVYVDPRVIAYAATLVDATRRPADARIAPAGTGDPVRRQPACLDQPGCRGPRAGVPPRPELCAADRCRPPRSRRSSAIAWCSPSRASPPVGRRTPPSTSSWNATRRRDSTCATVMPPEPELHALAAASLALAASPTAGATPEWRRALPPRRSGHRVRRRARISAGRRRAVDRLAAHRPLGPPVRAGGPYRSCPGRLAGGRRQPLDRLGYGPRPQTRRCGRACRRRRPVARASRQPGGPVALRRSPTRRGATGRRPSAPGAGAGTAAGIARADGTR